MEPIEGHTYHLGIDPGWKNLGVALVVEDKDGAFSKVKTEVINPSSYRDEAECALDIYERYIKFTKVSSITIERFVPFNGQATHEAENINLLIGAICGIIRIKEPTIQVLRVRSIEWKVAIVKALVKTRGFDNPSMSLDKKFSMAAAAACLGIIKLEKGITDHEADSICLASYQDIVYGKRAGR